MPSRSVFRAEGTSRCSSSGSTRPWSPTSIPSPPISGRRVQSASRRSSAIRAGATCATAAAGGWSCEVESSAASFGAPQLDDAVRADMIRMMAEDSRSVVRYGPECGLEGGGVAVFVAAYRPRPRMVIFGAVDFAAAVARAGAFLDYRVTVCDARPLFATHRRFPDADKIIVDWPHRYLTRIHQDGEVDASTVICVLTHDLKFDVPLLEAALRMPLGYIGVMGSRRTNRDRAARLRERGLTDRDLARLHAPVGLDLGARTPAETAVSIAAEIVANHRGGTGASLRHTQGPIHASRLSSKEPASEQPARW